MARYCYIGPWVWDAKSEDGPHWRGPTGTLGCIDLRSWEGCATREKVLGVGLFVTDRLLGPDYMLLAMDLDEGLKLTARSAIATLLGLPRLDATIMRNVLVETLLQRADPDQGRMVGPLGITHDGRWKVALPPFGVIYDRQFGGVNDPGWPTLQARLQRDYRSLREDCLNPTALRPPDAELYLRKLAVDAAKCGVDPQLLVPSDLPYEGIRAAGTIYSDNFDRADGALAAPWTVVNGSAAVSSNQVAAGAENSEARYDQDLSTDDHECSITFTAGTGSDGPGPACRFNAAARNFYFGRISRSGDSAYIYKAAAGVLTGLTEVVTQAGLGAIIKLSVDGTTLTCYKNGDQYHDPVTDNTYSGQTRCGIWFRRATSGERGDDWEAADLAVAVECVALPGQSLSQADLAALTQTHLLPALSAQSLSQADLAALTQTHLLPALSAQSLSQADLAALSQTHLLPALSAQSLSQAGLAALVQTHLLPALAGQSLSQADLASILFAHILEALAAQSASNAALAALLQTHLLPALSAQSLSRAALAEFWPLLAGPVVEGFLAALRVTGEIETPVIQKNFNAPVIRGVKE